MLATAKLSLARAGWALLLLLPLAACASAADLRRMDARQCTGYGFKAGTTAFAQCLQRESLARRYDWGSGPWFYGPGPPGW